MKKDSFEIRFFDKSMLAYNLKDKTFTIVGSFAHTCYNAKLRHQLSDKLFFRSIFKLANDKKSNLKFNPISSTILSVSNDKI